MSAVVKLSNQKSLEVCYICVDYLVNRCLREKGLFRNPPSVVEIRKLRTHMMDERQAKALKESVLDPHLVAGVLQLTLKDMPMSVFHKIYDLMISCSNESADFSRNKSDVIEWMCKLDVDTFNFIRTLAAFIHQLGTTPGNDANISQLVFIFAPLLCRPPNSAYMSVRHMEDLRKLRPTLQVVVENYLEIFNEAQPCAAEDSKPKAGLNPRSLNSDMESYATDIGRSSSSDQVAYSPTQEGGLIGDALLGSKFNKSKHGLNLQVAVHTTPPTDVNDSNLTAVAVRQVNFQSKEWNRLEQLVFAMSESFLKEPFQFFNPSKGPADPNSNDNGMVMSNENDLMACTIETFEAGNVGFGGGDAESPYRDYVDADEDRYWTQAGTFGPGELFSRSGRAPSSPSSSGNSSGAAHRASNRRKMVHECRTLRQQITKFEKDFALIHSRPPKGSEKGHMQQIYSKYRDMKREIRSSAAVDIQRLIRAFICRAKLRKSMKLVPVSPSRYSRSPARPSTSPGRSGSLHEMASSPKGESTAMSLDSNMWKSGVRGSTDSADFLETTAVDDANGQALYAKYKDLLLQKRTLKRRLKRFDEEFAAKHNRQPKKTDKEVMRPHYQKYHEVRNEMQILRATIERVMGSLPVELQEVPDGEQPLARPSSEPSSDSGGRPSRGDRLEQSSSTPSLPGVNDADHNNGGGEEDEELMTRYESHNHQGGDGRSGGQSDSVPVNGSSAGWLSASPTGTEGARFGSSALSSSNASAESGGWSRASTNNPADIEALQKEKRQLHIVLKAYERDFNQIHGRHVMKPEDIAPVAGEYQRYKELKKKLKDV